MKKLCFLSFLLATIIFYGVAIDASSKQITLFGAISGPHSEQLSGLPILFKGGLYAATTDKESDVKRAHFELYDDTKQSALHFLIIKADDLEIPCANDFSHLKIVDKKPYKLYKLTKYTVDMPPLDPVAVLGNKQLAEWRDSWHVAEIQLDDELTVPDATVIVFMDPAFVNRLEVDQWSATGTGIKLPTIHLRESITKQMLVLMKDMMIMGSINFRAFHKKPFKAIVPYAQNRLISMPFTPRGYNC